MPSHPQFFRTTTEQPLFPSLPEMAEDFRRLNLHRTKNSWPLNLLVIYLFKGVPPPTKSRLNRFIDQPGVDSGFCWLAKRQSAYIRPSPRSARHGRTEA